jgi:lactoylglutathione lyase
MFKVVLFSVILEVIMKFCWVTINVKDMDKSMDFYTRIVGLSVDRIMKPNPKMQIAFLGSGETKVELIYDPVQDFRNFGKDISVGFEVDSVDQMIKKLQENGIGIESGPHQPNPTIKFIYVFDPNGLHIQFVENIKASK